MSRDELFITLMLSAVAASWLLFVLPAVIAFRRQHPDRWAIAALNFLQGATGIGLLIALVWSLGVPPRRG